MPAGARITDRDRGYAALMRRVERAAVAKLVVGVLARDGDAPQEGGDTDVLAIAIVQEFGGGDVPERSFLRSWADTHRTENAARLRRVASVVVQGGNEERELGAVGREMADELRAWMRAGIAPPLAPSTIAEKGDATPLVGGQLEGAIGFEVRS
jgi:hypothetical protein